jgi:[CysO sulfur-carrier protein]-S-L-cysteine hydrolase
VNIARSAVDDMLAHAREDAPNECCGLLVGTRQSIDRVIRARNSEASPTRYRIDAEDHFAAIHSARADGLRVVGAYHSHPKTAALPSPSDIAEAAGGSDFVYVIVSLKGDDGNLFAYRLKGGSVIPVSLFQL